MIWTDLIFDTEIGDLATQFQEDLWLIDKFWFSEEKTCVLTVSCWEIENCRNRIMIKRSFGVFFPHVIQFFQSRTRIVRIQEFSEDRERLPFCFESWLDILKLSFEPNNEGDGEDHEYSQNCQDHVFDKRIVHWRSEKNRVHRSKRNLPPEQMLPDSNLLQESLLEFRQKRETSPSDPVHLKNRRNLVSNFASKAEIGPAQPSDDIVRRPVVNSRALPSFQKLVFGNETVVVFEKSANGRCTAAVFVDEGAVFGGRDRSVVVIVQVVVELEDC